MKKYKYVKLNAFTSGKSLGNPAAYLVTGEDRLTAEEMLNVGRQHKGFVCEVVFCEKSDKADVKLTYYSSECEVDFCGHGTIAAIHDLVKNDENLLAKDEIKIETNRRGLLTALNRIKDEDAVYITAPKAENLTVPVSEEEIAAELGFKPEQIDDSRPIDFINAGLNTLIVPIKSKADEISVYPCEAELKEFCSKHKFDNFLIYSDAVSGDHIFHTRIFAPKFGYLEDPATGSGNSAFANYMLKYNMWDGKPANIEQGGDNAEFNTVRVMKKGEDILFGGGTTVAIRGEYYIG